MSTTELEIQCREAHKQLRRVIRQRRAYDLVESKLHDYKTVDRRDWL